jgi:hypothetical protein
LVCGIPKLSIWYSVCRNYKISYFKAFFFAKEVSVLKRKKKTSPPWIIPFFIEAQISLIKHVTLEEDHMKTWLGTLIITGLALKVSTPYIT